MSRFFLFALLVIASLAGCSERERDPVAVSAGRIGETMARAPTGTIGSLVIYLSDISGLEPSDTEIVDKLVESGSVVMAIDLSDYARKLDADPGSCLYVVGELTDLGQSAQRALGSKDYLAPILVGRGQGGTFAYAALADAPHNTLGGAVAAGFQNRLSLRLPFCPGATATPLPDQSGFSYSLDKVLPEQGRLLVAVDDLAQFKAETAGEPTVEVEALAARPLPEQIADVVGAIAGDAALDGLPVVPIKAQGTSKGIVVFVSGDGGWRDLDKTMGEWMATQGFDVLGVDALRYFWGDKPPEQFAADITTLVMTADPSARLPVLLVGYSFGADTLPFAWPHLSEDLQNRIGTVALLGPGLATGFQISVSGWLGMTGGSEKVVPAIAAIPSAKVLCVYGVEEKASACLDPALAAVARIRTGGGHHFDGDYQALGERVLEIFGKRPR